MKQISQPTLITVTPEGATVSLTDYAALEAQNAQLRELVKAKDAGLRLAQLVFKAGAAIVKTREEKLDFNQALSAIHDALALTPDNFPTETKGGAATVSVTMDVTTAAPEDLNALMSAQPVADGPAGFSDAERNQFVENNGWGVVFHGGFPSVGHESDYGPEQGEPSSWSVVKDCEVLSRDVCRNTAIDEAIRAARKGQQETL